MSDGVAHIMNFPENVYINDSLLFSIAKKKKDSLLYDLFELSLHQVNMQNFKTGKKIKQVYNEKKKSDLRDESKLTTSS